MATLIASGERGDRTLLAVVDGLGHGQGAKEAAARGARRAGRLDGRAARRVVARRARCSARTRGAVMGVVVLDHAARDVSLCGRRQYRWCASSARPSTPRPISANGTLGARLGTVARLDVSAGQRARHSCMASDGLSASWDIRVLSRTLEEKPADAGRHPDARLRPRRRRCDSACRKMRQSQFSVFSFQLWQRQVISSLTEN